ncbi:YwmB family TATA-box binding protein [Intestinibacter sp.]
MKLFKPIICLFIVFLSLFSVVMIYGQSNQTEWIDKFIESFEMTDSNFKFYNLKSSIMIQKDVDIKELQSICVEIAQNLGDNHNELNLKKRKSEIFVNYNDKNTVISIVGVKKNSKEFYIIVDILNNKVYKNIENIYVKLENELEKYSNQININVCIAGEYTKKLKNTKISDILQKILYNMYAEKIDDIEEENFLSVNAYSKLLKENNLKYLNREMNLNIGIRYSEDDDRTTIYMATPIIKIDY